MRRLVLGLCVVAGACGRPASADHPSALPGDVLAPPSLISPFVPLPWITFSDEDFAHLGHSVASAGDVNGDGYDDVILGELGYSNGEDLEGRAIVFLGSASGLPQTPGWIAEPDVARASFGASVASAGDVNGDGYDDVIVGAPGYPNDDGGAGRVFEYDGSANGLSTTPTWTAESGLTTRSLYGDAVASAGDVNGDGYSDVIVGAESASTAFVYLGSADGLGAEAAWTPEALGGLLGESVASAGDVNHDGYDDVLVGAPTYDNGPVRDVGAVFLYEGSATGLGAHFAWSVVGDQDAALFGHTAASAGDVDGDGYDDVIVGAYEHTGQQPEDGAAWLYLGSASGPAATPSWTGEIAQASARFGVCVASAGDINDDGYDDIAVGAEMYDDPESQEGGAFLFLGSPTGPAASPALQIESNQIGANLGTSLASAGDVNGDGADDVIIGSPEYDGRHTGAGVGVLYLGVPPTPVDTDVPADTDTDAIRDSDLRADTDVATDGDDATGRARSTCGCAVGDPPSGMLGAAAVAWLWRRRRSSSR